MTKGPDSYAVRDLRQAKLLADPFRLRLLHALADCPGTVKGIADTLGEPVSRLYRHIHALHNAGLLKVVSRRRVRGTIEKRYQAVARRFEFDHSLLGATSSKRKQHLTRRRQMAVQMVEQARDRLTALTDDSVGIVMRAQFFASRDELAQLQTELVSRLEKLAETKPRAKVERPSWTATIAFYPTDDPSGE
jgi:predicted ArsR family transcriptional regulator